LGVRAAIGFTGGLITLAQLRFYFFGAVLDRSAAFLEFAGWLACSHSLYCLLILQKRNLAALRFTCALCPKQTPATQRSRGKGRAQCPVRVDRARQTLLAQWRANAATIELKNDDEVGSFAKPAARSQQGREGDGDREKWVKASIFNIPML
jgi:hypothetical protein